MKDDDSVETESIFLHRAVYLAGKCIVQFQINFPN